MRARSWLLLTGLVLISAACGGRLVERSDDDGNGASNAGGTSSTGTGAGPSGNGAAPSSGGKATGIGGMATGTGGKATGVGGKTTGLGGSTTGSGGASLCPDIPCKNIACGPNQARVPTPDGCCYSCENVCPPCPGIACGSGSHLEMIPGACCPTCVQDSCEDQRKAYLQFRQQLYEKYSSLGCMANADCTLFWEKNWCNVGCGVPMPVAAIRNLDSNLQSYAQQSCSPSCGVPTLPCEPTVQPICFEGRCE
ncbi:MAG TPA: hypothetical protein VHP33_29520 [Polyangiaceae bacterium]|nr:hypothetical protein [Polyangiaceae bacterium]